LSPRPSANLDAPPQTAKTDSTTSPLNLEAIPAKARELYTTAKEQEQGFKQLLEGLSQPSSTLEAGNLLKSVGSIESKLERKQGRIESVNDLLRGAIIAKDREVLDEQLAQIAIKLREAQIPHTIEYKENRGSGYEGIHIHFKHNNIPAEIQVHTPKNWAVKKKQDEKYHIIREEEINPTLSKEELAQLKQESKALGQDSDLDIKLLTSFEVISTESTSAKSLNRLNADTDSNLTHILRLKSNSKTPSSPGAEIAYKRPDSVLNQKEEILTGGKGIDSGIQTPLPNPTKPPLNNQTPLLPYKSTYEVVQRAKEQGLSPAQTKVLVQENKERIAGLLPYKREVDIKGVIFKEDIKSTMQILQEGRQAYLNHAQILQALNKAKELKSTAPSAYELTRHKQSRLAQLQDGALEEEWLTTFNLKSLDAPFIPSFSPQVQEALEPILKGEPIKLTRGSLVKLEKRQREEFLPLIKPTLEQSDMILRDKENALIFVKDMGKKYYFTSVARSNDGSWTIRTNSYKTLNRLKNIVSDLGEVLYIDEKAPNILAETFKAKTFSNQLTDDSSAIGLKGQIKPNPAFGENFKEFALKGKEAVAKLLQEKRGQVAGAFYRPDLGESGGYIDLVWGNYELKASPGAKKPKSYGLSKILEKHASDFESFRGANIEEKLANGLEYLIKNGESKTSPTGIKTIVIPTKEGEFRVGLSKGWFGKGNNTWVITAYEHKNPPVETFGQSTSSKEVSKESGHGHLAQKGEEHSTTTPLKAQTPKSAEELIESLAVDNATAKKYNM
ncbi:PBECR2 nuclease fold domain-containing protein, partial [Helicobacter mehlei]|uniref:putative barnase/colicin E5 family endoribonuclease n=1 Tax=Helicobacter mehlei TaxID=2316080 RepID=UPI002286CFF9